MIKGSIKLLSVVVLYSTSSTYCSEILPKKWSSLLVSSPTLTSRIILEGYTLNWAKSDELPVYLYIRLSIYLLMRLFFMLQVVFLWHPKTYLPYRRWAVGLVGLRNLAAPKPCLLAFQQFNLFPFAL